MKAPAMLRPLLTAAALAALLTTTTAAPAHAGRSCEQRLPEASAVQRSIELAERTRQALDTSGLQWSHLGLAYRDPYAGGAWRIVHKLNQCGSARADVYRQGLAEFFLDDPWQYRAALAPLAPAAQAKLMAVLDDNRRVTGMHAAGYSMVAYPWSQRYQQSNQWVIETLAMAHDPAASSRERAQAWLRLHGYEPTVLRIGAMTRLGARLTAANVAFDDHPNDKRYSDRIETVTADSVFAWLERSALAGRVQVVR
jgi:hypothetical protein